MKMLREVFKSQQGQALVELALVLPILLMLLFGIIEFGRIFGAYMVITNLSREGARYGVVGHDDSQIQNLIISGRAWLDESKFTITLSPPYTERDKGDSLGVTIDYPVDLLLPIVAEILPNPVNLSVQCLMRVE
ncbi:MAG: pilus assembly protein TadE [Firmicutes bacterium HGW-Firmicutes-15]|nr:MAG: pilus assembly protein TadE [Firmicutes bacterium HGW-Firmicutes-15]